MPKFIYWFSEIDKGDVSLVGGKAANLGELSRSGLPIPPGFAIGAITYFHFLEASKIKDKLKKLLSKLDVDNQKLLDEASLLIKKVITSAEIPPNVASEIKEAYSKLSSKGEGLVAVRSSATAEDLKDTSFAGQQSTYLNIRGERELLDAVKKCWVSLYEARAIFYREQKKFDHFKVGMAVVVQEMVQSETSGVMFTIDPVSNAKNKIVIEAVWGLGEMIVQGIATPDHYEVDKKTFEILDRQITSQENQLIRVGKVNKEIRVAKKYQASQKLPNPRIMELAKIGKKIEDHYGFPQDVEWAFARNQLYIVQTRAVTTVKANHFQGNISLNLPLIIEGSPASPGIGVGFPKVINGPKQISRIKLGDILVASMTNPDYVPAMKKASAIVTDKGGRTSHAAIVSRELGIPCVVGTEKSTSVLKHHKAVITVNGSAGKIYKGALSAQRLSAIAAVAQKEQEAAGALKTATKVYVNLGEKGLVREVAQKNVDGIGLLRAEFMIAEIGSHPKKMLKEKKREVFIKKLSESIAVFAQSFDPRPVIYRATDFKTNEYKNLRGGEKYEQDEPNPLMGFRGAYRYISDPEVFEMELDAIKTVRNKMGFKNLWLMIPFVRTIKEMEDVKKIVSASGLHRSASFKLLMMCEIPSNVLLIDKFLDLGIDGVSIGSNDLTMLILGVDRDNDTVAEEFNELDPAVLESMERVIKECRKRKLYSGICGQAPSVYPELTDKLVEWGVSSISVSPDAIEKTRKHVHEAEKKLLSKK